MMAQSPDMRSTGSVSRCSSSSGKKSLVYCVDANESPTKITGPPKIDQAGVPTLLTAKRMLIAVWMSVGLMPLLLQARSYLKFVTPHKISQDLIVPTTATKHTADMESLCPMEGLVIAGAWWNVAITHYYELEESRVCHFVVPQYNIHGNYVWGSEQVAPSGTAPSSCSENSYYLEYYFYHGSIGYYAFYEEAVGTLCADDNIGYVLVRGLGTYDSNGAHLADDTGDSSYRRSYWYGLFGSLWIVYRSLLLRRSYISCRRYGRRCDRLREPMLFKDAVVFVQESMRLSAHGARNYHRAVLVYLLVEGLMSDLFMLIAQDGLLAKVQYISLGYNLSGVLSMLFEMVETMNWMGEKLRCLIKRLLFNYETALLGELACSAAMQFYLTGLNKSSLKGSKPVAEAVSYYIWSLVGHGIIVLGIVFVITSIRSLGAVINVRIFFGSFALLLTPCCVDTAIGPRCKMIMLSGYVWEDGKLFYKAETLKAFGVLKIVEEDGASFIAIHRLHWVAIPFDLMVFGELHGHNVTQCGGRPCHGTVTMVGRTLGGPTVENSPSVKHISIKALEVCSFICGKLNALMMEELGSTQSKGSIPPSKKRSRVQSLTEIPSVLYDVVIARRMLMLVWMTVGIIPLLLQGRSYWKFVTPHKLTEYLVVTDGVQREMASIEAFCPVEGLFVSHAWWNIEITHYYSLEQRQICHFVIPQYNVHGAYILGTKKVKPFSTTPESCASDSFYFEYYFYHGSLGYYAFYEEGVGTFCNLDKTAYVRVRGVGTLDMNGVRLANDTGDFGYRCSYWYSLLGAVWISYRVMMLRKSYILCKQYGRRCDRMNEKLQRKNAVVFMQECMRLSAHGTTNYHRLALMYLLLESLMSDLFLLIAQDGILSRLQYLSLGYNLAGVLSMLFEIFESMHWVKENTRLLLKRLLFSYETSLLGELLSAGLMQHYLTWINRSSLRHSRPSALAVSYYMWSLIGHGIIVVGLAGFVMCVRVTSVTIYAWWVHKTLKVLTASCCVDTTLGIRSKMILLGGYLWEEGKLYYKADALKSFGILKMVEKDGTEFFVIRTVHWIRVPRHDLLVIGQVIGNRVEPCSERLCTGRICLFDRSLGGDLNQPETLRNRNIRVGNRVAAGPQPLSVLPSYKISTSAHASKARHPARISRQSSYQKN